VSVNRVDRTQLITKIACLTYTFILHPNYKYKIMWIEMM